MAHSKQALKRNRQNITARLRNRQVKSDIKTVIKAFRANTAGAESAKRLSEVEAKLDKAAKRRIIPAGRANRLKSRLRLLAGKKPAAPAQPTA